jgi:hypothetical protein
MTEETRIDTTLMLKHIHSTFSVDCPLLAVLAPEVYFAKRWDCGPQTFDFLLDFLLGATMADEDDRKAATQKVLDGKWELAYRDAPIYRGAQTPEDRLWPA